MAEAHAELKTFADKINAEGCTEAVFAKYAQSRSDCGSYANGASKTAGGSSILRSWLRPQPSPRPLSSASGRTCVSCCTDPRDH